MQPLVILLYERILPGSQLANRFRDMGYRVQTLGDPALLGETARREMPLLVLVDLPFEGKDPGMAITGLRSDQGTMHLPVIAIIPAGDKAWEERAVQCGATLVVNDNAVVQHLDQLLQQALQID